MDFIAGLGALLFEVLPARLAAFICAVVTGAVAFGGLKWYEHESNVVNQCNSIDGRMSQVFNGSATVNCGGASFFHWAALALTVGAGIVCISFCGFLVVLLVKGDKGKLFDKETNKVVQD